MQWRPDTCDCCIEENYDAATDTFTFVRSVKTCAFHVAIGGVPQHYDVVLSENQGKNRALGAALDLLPSIVEDGTSDDGKPVKNFKPGKEPSWLFTVDPNSPKRKLKVRFQVPDAAAKGIQTALRAQLKNDAPEVTVEGVA